MTKRGGWRDSYEQDVVHPAVARILTETGYKYQHEAPMPIRGKVDFLGMHIGDGHLFVVECKVKQSDFMDAVDQVLGYRDQFGVQVKAGLAFPVDAISDDMMERCQREELTLLQVPVPTLTKLSIEVPKEWLRPLRIAADKAGHQSLNTYIRDLLGQVVEAQKFATLRDAK